MQRGPDASRACRRGARVCRVSGACGRCARVGRAGRRCARRRNHQLPDVVPAAVVMLAAMIVATEYDQRPIRKRRHGMSVAGDRHGVRCRELRPDSGHVIHLQQQDVVE